MNARKSRELRRQAEELTIGLPAVSYRAIKHPMHRNVSTQLILGNCTRKVYKELKRIAKGKSYYKEIKTRVII